WPATIHRPAHAPGGLKTAPSARSDGHPGDRHPSPRLARLAVAGRPESERSVRTSREQMEQLIDRWVDDPAFRAAVRQGPEGAVRGTGLELNADEWAAVRSIDWSLSDEELSSRASKLNSSGCADGTL